MLSQVGVTPPPPSRLVVLLSLAEMSVLFLQFTLDLPTAVKHHVWASISQRWVFLRHFYNIVPLTKI